MRLLEEAIVQIQFLLFQLVCLLYRVKFLKFLIRAQGETQWPDLWPKARDLKISTWSVASQRTLRHVVVSQLCIINRKRNTEQMHSELKDMFSCSVLFCASCSVCNIIILVWLFILLWHEHDFEVDVHLNTCNYWMVCFCRFSKNTYKNNKIKCLYILKKYYTEQ